MRVIIEFLALHIRYRCIESRSMDPCCLGKQIDTSMDHSHMHSKIILLQVAYRLLDNHCKLLVCHTIHIGSYSFQLQCHQKILVQLLSSNSNNLYSTDNIRQQCQYKLYWMSYICKHAFPSSHHMISSHHHRKLSDSSMCRLLCR